MDLSANPTLRRSHPNADTPSKGLAAHQREDRQEGQSVLEVTQGDASLSFKSDEEFITAFQASYV